MFAIFENLKSFNEWHEAILEKNNFPLFGHNAATNEIDLEHPITKYTEPRLNHNDERVIAWVGEETDNLQIIDENATEWATWFIGKAPWEISG